MTAAARPLPPSLVPVLPPKLAAAGQEFCVYGTEYLPLQANAVRQQASFKVGEDHAFLIVAAARLYLTEGNAIIANDEALALVTMGPVSSSQQLIQPTAPLVNDSPVDNWFGIGKAWSYWSYPFCVRPNETFVVALTNLEAVARNYRLSFIGAKLYRSRGVDPWAWARGGF